MKAHVPQLLGRTAAPYSNAWSIPLSALNRQQTRKQHSAAACKASPRPLLLDNYDSYTFNLYQIIAEAYRADPLVLHNDEVDIAAVQQMLQAGDIHHIILSPGPGTPHNPKDMGVCLDVLQQCASTPVLGVCLGQQAMAVAAGGRVVRAPEPVHGRLSTLEHTGHELFAGCPSGPGSGFDVVRYHSLVVDSSSLPAELEALAWTCSGHQAVSLDHPQLHVPTDAVPDTAAAASPGADRLIMALRHRHRPHYGVQFHPESVATRYGVQLLHNFRDIACRHSGHSLQPQQRVQQQRRKQQQQRPQQRRNQQQQRPQQQQPQHLQQDQLNLVGPPGREMPPRPWPVNKSAPGAAAAAASVAAVDSSVRKQQQQQQQQQQHHDHHQPLQDQQQDGQQQPQGVDHLSALAPASLVGPGGLQLLWRKLPGAADAVTGGSAALFSQLVGPGPDTFWLDSSSAPERARFSYMGGPGLGTGLLWRRVTYKLPPPSAAAANGVQPGLLSVSQGDGRQQQQQQEQPQQEAVQASVFDYLQRQMQQLQLQPTSAAAAAAELPFNFWGGFVGYLGYELKAECGGSNAHAAPGPDAAWLFADRVLVVDHKLGDVWLLALTPAAAGSSAAAGAAAATEAVTAEQWLHEAASRVQRMAMQVAPGSSSSQVLQQPPGAGVVRAAAQLRHDRAAYVANAAACREALVAGDSYELCLTTSYTMDGTQGMQPLKPWDFYSTLRSINPAPYSAWLSFGSSTAVPGVTVCCSSPERFLSCSRGGVLEAKPIKGTARRHPSDTVADWASAAALLGSEKERAENLMIVDLLRNDLGRVCEPGSVHVPGLIQLESYSSVHQLVSTVRGLLRPDASCVDAVRAAFPGGSMTGAPKVRSMEILDGLEGAARGVYSGALGYLSVNDTFDLNIVIRTAVFLDQPADPAAVDSSTGSGSVRGGSSRHAMTIGAGGAITVQSDPEAEFAEMQLKAERLLTAAAMAQQQQLSQHSSVALSAQPAAVAAPPSPAASAAAAVSAAAVRTVPVSTAADKSVAGQEREAVRR